MTPTRDHPIKDPAQSPRPLTLCEAPDLDWSRPNTPAATGFGDIYFSVDGGLDESRAVFLAGCDLPNAWHGCSHYLIGELGFGTGLNFLAVWDLWEKQGSSGHLSFVSIEKFPFSKADLERALSVFPQFQPYIDRLLALWPGRVRGVHRLEVSESVTLTLIHDDVLSALQGLDVPMDAWFLDGFSPAKNPEMWSEPVMNLLAARSKIGTRLATFTVAGAVRTALVGAGFSVFKKEGYGRKRHRLEAVFDGHSPTSQTPQGTMSASGNTALPKNPIIIGGGIAGASVCRSLERLGITPTLIERADSLQRAASGNPCALIKPRFDLQDRPESRFFLSSFLYACQAYHATPHVLTTGINHLLKDQKDVRRFEKLAAQAPLGDHHLYMGKGAVIDRVSLLSSLIINPLAILALWKQSAKKITATISKIEKIEGQFQVSDEKGTIIACGDALILCAGAGITDFKIETLSDLRFSRGQLSWAKPVPELSQPITYGGYAVPLEPGLLIGATHGRRPLQEPYKSTDKEDIENFEKFESATGHKPRAHSLPSRVSVRVTTPNTLPRVGCNKEGFWVLTGLGSRGFVFAPLLGAHISSKLLGHVSPIPTSLLGRFGLGNTS